MSDFRSSENSGEPDLWLVDRLLAAESDAGPAERERVRMGADPADRERVRMAAIVNALRQPGTAAELAEETSYLNAFDEASQTPDRKPMRTIVIGTRAAVAAGIAVLAAATGAAAYTGSLPGPLQRVAHSVVGAPADDQGSGDATDEATDEATDSATPTESPTGSDTSHAAVGPDATGPAAFGLCTAWSKGGLATTSVSYLNLSTAAGGADGIAAYCATIVKPGSTATHPSGSPTSHPGGSPTSHPGGSPTSHPGGSPTSHPVGSPTSHPGGH
jgi:hypothetical protein